MTTPTVHALRQGFPNARITYLAEAPYSDLLFNHPDIDHILIANKVNKRAMRALYLALMTTHFDIAIDLFCNPRSAVMMWLSGARIRIGGDFRGRRLLYNKIIPFENKQRTAVDFHLNYLSPLGFGYDKVEPYIQVTKEEKAWARSYLSDRDIDIHRPIIGLHPGATWPAKRWLPERFAALATRIVHETKGQILFTMGPNEQDLLNTIIAQCGFKAISPEVLPLRRLAALLSQCDVYVCNDCGPLHLAPAVGTPVIGIFGPGTPEIWFPYKRELGHRLVHHQLDCSRCHQDFCEKLDCMHAISIATVFDAIVDSLESQGKTL